MCICAQCGKNLQTVLYWLQDQNGWRAHFCDAKCANGYYRQHINPRNILTVIGVNQ